MNLYIDINPAGYHFYDIRWVSRPQPDRSLYWLYLTNIRFVGLAEQALDAPDIQIRQPARFTLPDLLCQIYPVRFTRSTNHARPKALPTPMPHPKRSG